MNSLLSELYTAIGEIPNMGQVHLNLFCFAVVDYQNFIFYACLALKVPTLGISPISCGGAAA